MSRTYMYGFHITSHMSHVSYQHHISDITHVTHGTCPHVTCIISHIVLHHTCHMSHIHRTCHTWYVVSTCDMSRIRMWHVPHHITCIDITHAQHTCHMSTLSIHDVTCNTWHIHTYVTSTWHIFHSCTCRVLHLYNRLIPEQEEQARPTKPTS